ncbi:MAG: hypothetical protein ACK521_09930 [bacterium]
MIKDARQRPNVLDILKMKYVNQHMRQFVEREGQNSDDLKLHLRRDI